MKKLFLTLLTAITYLGLNAQCSPTKWEGVGYTNITASAEDSLVLKSFQKEIDSLLCFARDNNKTRLWISVLPKQLQDLNYVKKLTTKDYPNLTVPIFKLVVWDNKTSEVKPIMPTEEIVEIKKKQNTEKADSIYKANYSSFPELTVLPGYTNQVDSKAKFSRYVEDPYIEVLDSISIAYGGYIDFAFSCFTRAKLKSVVELTKLEKIVEYYQEWHNHTGVLVRFHVDKEGYVQHVSQRNLSVNLSKSSCIKDLTNLYVRFIVEYYDFKPAIKNGEPVESYVDIVFDLSGLPPVENNKTERKYKN